MCSFNILSFNNHFHSQGNSESDSPIHQSFIPSSFSKLQSKDLLGAPSFSASKCSCNIFALQQVLQSIQLFDSSPLLSASALLLCFKANPPLHAFLKNKYKFSLAFIHSFQSMHSRVKTLSYISVQTMQFHVANSTSFFATTQGVQNMDQP